MFRSRISVPEIVSCDVFDTLLLRDLRCEPRRFQAMAQRAARELRNSYDIDIDERAVLRARVEAHRFAYRALDIIDPRGDVQFHDLVDVMAVLLGLDACCAHVLARAEIAVESSQLSPNRKLFDWLDGQAHAGRRIIAVSDTWHEAHTIARLLDGLVPDHPIAAVYTSSDRNTTKRLGLLFQDVLNSEGAKPEQVIHIGDDPRADLAMARAAGLHCQPASRPGHIRLARKLDAVLFRSREAFLLH